ncbi:electron transport complex protein RnfG [Candidatus Termititenax persephonae]|uniref:Ion-translocating oxidoreductase complex subunit G n=1 Tax=Candidatus Termititenax persephonae TaxID=2218525 RepID=A0A388THW0_9BACT|nr:electron transport complex protein RnfG [Candidatus Termititenax persephonae]
MGKVVILILKYALILAIFCGAAGLLLSAAHDLTEPHKVRNQEKQKIAGQKLLFPGAVKIDGAEVYTAGGQLAGYLLPITVRGYSSDIEMLVGLDTEYQIRGLQVLSQAETPGLGTRVADKSFAAQLRGSPAQNLRLRKDGGAVDGITGATITSRAVIDGIRQEVRNFQKSKGVK